MLVSFIRLCFSLVFMLPGTLITFPLSTAISFYSEREKIRCLKASTVKITGNDVLATTKIVAYISTYPFYLILFSFLFNKYLQSYTGIEETYYLLFFFLFPLLSIISIRSYDGVKTHYTDF